MVLKNLVKHPKNVVAVRRVGNNRIIILFSYKNLVDEFLMLHNGNNSGC